MGVNRCVAVSGAVPTVHFFQGHCFVGPYCALVYLTCSERAAAAEVFQQPGVPHSLYVLACLCVSISNAPDLHRRPTLSAHPNPCCSCHFYLLNWNHTGPADYPPCYHYH